MACEHTWRLACYNLLSHTLSHKHTPCLTNTLPGDTRNDIYVTLEHGQFEKGSKRAERNVEVSVEAVDNQGNIIPVSGMSQTHDR